MAERNGDMREMITAFIIFVLGISVIAYYAFVICKYIEILNKHKVREKDTPFYLVKCLIPYYMLIDGFVEYYKYYKRTWR